MTSRGIDLLGYQAVEVTRLTTGQIQRKTLQESLPSIILPIIKQEPATTGEEAYSHRRGRGLVWPPEAQVPVLGDPANGSGRVLLAAVFEKLCRAEKSWGHLDDTSFAWRPEGRESLEVEAAKLIACEIEAATQQDANIGLVVPDALGVAGQEALLSSFRSSRVLLVPRSIAVSLAWAEANRDTLSTGPINAYAGYLTVVEAGLGRWSLSKVPVYRTELDGEPWLTAAHFPRLKKTDFNITGCSVLAASLGQDPKSMLRQRWQQPLLAGNSGIVLHLPSKQMRSSIDSLQILDGSHDITGPMGALTELKAAQDQLKVMAEYGSSLGLIVTGALSNVRFTFGQLCDEIGRRLGLKLLHVNDDSAASGAALAARGLDSRWPTWLEMLEPLDLYYLGRSEIGDIEGAWKSVLPEKLLKAGSEWRNQEPISGLKLQAGRNSVQITIRRPEKSKFQFKKVETTTGQSASEDIPLIISVVAKPGQGFAVVTVDSKEPGSFNSRLDWHKLQECAEPTPPPLAYLIRSVELVVSGTLWYACIDPLKALHLHSNAPVGASLLLNALKSACSVTRKAVSQESSAPWSFTPTAEDIFRLYSPFGQFGKPPTEEGRRLLLTTTETVVGRLPYHGRAATTGQWMRRYLAYLRLACPKVLLDEVINEVKSRPSDCTAVDLLVVGLCFKTSSSWTFFYKAFIDEIYTTPRPSSWLKALRDIIKFNENALASIDSSTSNKLFFRTIRTAEDAISKQRPLIAQLSFESLLFLLKCRRYNPSFAEPESDFYNNALACVNAVEKTTMIRRRTKLKESVNAFSKFLQLQGDLNDIGTLMQDDDDDED